MTKTKAFHIGDILSITTGRLVSPRHIDGVYDILGWLTGDNLFTHQLPRASREAEPILKARYPDLATVVVPEGLSGQQAVEDWLSLQVARFGETREVAPLDAEDHTHVDPLTELSMNYPDTKVIVVQP